MSPVNAGINTKCLRHEVKVILPVATMLIESCYNSMNKEVIQSTHTDQVARALDFRLGYCMYTKIWLARGLPTYIGTLWNKTLMAGDIMM